MTDVFEKSYSVDISIPVSNTERIENFAEAVTPKLYPLVVELVIVFANIFSKLLVDNVCYKSVSLVKVVFPTNTFVELVIIGESPACTENW